MRTSSASLSLVQVPLSTSTSSWSLPCTVSQQLQWLDSCVTGWWTTCFIFFPFSLNFEHGFGGILWPVCPTELGMLIPRTGKDFVVGPLGVLFLDQVLFTVTKTPQPPAVRVSYGLGNGSFLLPVLVSGLTLLKSLVLWDCIFGQLFQVS